MDISFIFDQAKLFMCNFVNWTCRTEITIAFFLSQRPFAIVNFDFSKKCLLYIFFKVKNTLVFTTVKP